MLTVLCVLILNYLVFSEAASNSKSVNVALETVLEFDNKDIKSDVQIIDNVQKFLAKVRNVLDKSPDFRTTDKRERIKFTDFVENALIILKSFTDDDLEELVVVVDDELRKYHYKGCKFYELVQNDDLRSFITENLAVMRATPAKQLKKYIDNVQKKLQNKSFDKQETNFIDYINSLYSGDTSESMYNVLQNLQQYNSGTKRSNDDLVKIVKDAVRSVVFDHYSNLNVNARKDLRIKVATYLIDYSAKDKKMNSTILRFNTVKVEVEGTTPDSSFVEKMHKILAPFRELKNESLLRSTVMMTDAETKRKPFISLFPEEITTASTPKKKKSKRSKKKRTSTTPMIPMQTLWEETRATTKKTKEGHVKKTKKVVEEDKPLKREILTEHNAVINVESTYSPLTTTKKKSRHRHNKKHKSKRTKASTDKSTETTATTKKKIMKKNKNSKGQTVSKEDSEETATKAKAIRKTFDLSLGDGLSIETFAYPRRFLSRKSNYVLGKRSQRRREEHARLKRRSRYSTITTISTTDSNFILNKINNIERELENVKHRMDVTSTHVTKATPTTDLPFWEPHPEDFKTIRGVTTTTTTTEPLKNEEKTKKTVAVTNTTIVNFTPSITTTASPATPPIIIVPNTTTTTPLTTTSPTVPTSTTTTISSTPAATTIRSVVFRTLEKSTFLPVILHENKTIARILKPVVEFADDEEQNDDRKDLKEQDNMIIKENEIIYNQTEIRKDFNHKDVNVLSINSKKTTKKDDLKSTTKEITTKTTVAEEVQTLSFFGLHKSVQKLSQNNSIRPNINSLDKVRRFGFLSPDGKCDTGYETTKLDIRTFHPLFRMLK